MEPSWLPRDIDNLSSSTVPGTAFLYSNHPFSSSISSEQQASTQFSTPNNGTNTTHSGFVVSASMGGSIASGTPEPWMHANQPSEYTIENHRPILQRLDAPRLRGNHSGCYTFPFTSPPPQQHGLLSPPELRSMDISDDEESSFHGEQQQQHRAQGRNILSYNTSPFFMSTVEQSTLNCHRPLVPLGSTSSFTEPQSTDITTPIDITTGTSQHIDSQQYLMMMHEATNKVLSLASLQSTPATTQQSSQINWHPFSGTAVHHLSHHLRPPPIALKRVNSSETFVSSTPSSPLIFSTLSPSNPPPSIMYDPDYFASLPLNNSTGSTRRFSSSEMDNAHTILDAVDQTATPRSASSLANAQEHHHRMQSWQHPHQVQSAMSPETLLMKQPSSSSSSSSSEPLPSSFSTSFPPNCSNPSASLASPSPSSPIMSLAASPFPSRSSTRSTPVSSSVLHKSKFPNTRGRRPTPTPSGNITSTCTSAFTKTTFDPSCSSSSFFSSTSSSSSSSASSSSSPLMTKKNKARFVCHIPNCQRTFSRPFNLKSHGLTHETERPHGCGLCSKSFSRIHDRDRHRKGHLIEKAHSCVVCLGRFARQDAVTRHLKLSNEQNPCSLILKSRGLSFRDAAAGRITREMLGQDEGEIRRMLEQLEDLSRRAKATRNLKMGMIAMNMNLNLNLNFEDESALEMESSRLGPPRLYDSQDW